MHCWLHSQHTRLRTSLTALAASPIPVAKRAEGMRARTAKACTLGAEVLGREVGREGQQVTAMRRTFTHIHKRHTRDEEENTKSSCTHKLQRRRGVDAPTSHRLCPDRARRVGNGAAALMRSHCLRRTTTGDMAACTAVGIAAAPHARGRKERKERRACVGYARARHRKENHEETTERMLELRLTKTRQREKRKGAGGPRHMRRERIGNSLAAWPINAHAASPAPAAAGLHHAGMGGTDLTSTKLPPAGPNAAPQHDP